MSSFLFDSEAVEAEGSHFHTPLRRRRCVLDTDSEDSSERSSSEAEDESDIEPIVTKKKKLSSKSTVSTGEKILKELQKTNSAIDKLMSKVTSTRKRLRAVEDQMKAGNYSSSSCSSTTPKRTRIRSTKVPDEVNVSLF